MASIRFLNLRDFLRCASRDDLAAAGTAFGAEVDDVVGGLDDVEGVFDDEDRVARIYQLLQHVEQLMHVGKMQAGRGLVEDVDRLAGRSFGEFLRKLDPLSLAAR